MIQADPASAAESSKRASPSSDNVVPVEDLQLHIASNALFYEQREYSHGRQRDGRSEGAGIRS